jgi:hypothetical protein
LNHEKHEKHEKRKKMKVREKEKSPCLLLFFPSFFVFFVVPSSSAFVVQSSSAFVVQSSAFVVPSPRS